MVVWIIKIKFIEKHEMFHQFKWNMYVDITLTWDTNARECYYVCIDAVNIIVEKMKTKMICKWLKCSYHHYKKD